MKTFDKESVYDSEIDPLMKQIIAICNEHEIPFIASFCYRNTEGGDSDLCTSYRYGPGKEPHPNIHDALKAVRCRPSIEASSR